MCGCRMARGVKAECWGGGGGGLKETMQISIWKRGGGRRVKYRQVCKSAVA